MNKRAGHVLRLATPLKALAQRFALLLLFGASFGLMLIGKMDSVIVERARVEVVDAVAPILNVIAEPVGEVSSALGDARELAELRQLNTELKVRNDRLQGWHQRALALDSENAALRELLRVAPDPNKSFVSARIVADQTGVFARSVLVAVGAKDGAKIGQAVLSGSGLVGRVVEVGEEISRVLLLGDINSRIPVIVGPARDRAVLTGENTGRPRLNYLAPGTSISPGDRVITSGHGGAFPAGLAVGIVVVSDEGEVRVRPYAEVDDLDFLRLVDYELPDQINRFTAGQ